MRWPWSTTKGATGDLSQDDLDPSEKKKVDEGLRPTVEDVRTVRRIHRHALYATVVPIVALLVLLALMVWSFSAHIRNSTDFMLAAVGAKENASESTIYDAAPARFQRIALTAKEEVKEAKDTKDKDESKSKDDASAKPLSDRAHLYAMLSSYQTNLSTSAVAVISILVIATTVISVSLLRAAMDIKPMPPAPQPKMETVGEIVEPKKDQGIPWPSFQFLKDAADVVLSLFKKKE
jgi:hypothetical protein